MAEKILVVGSSNTDMVIVTKKFPLPGETVLGGKFFMNPGGKGANQAVAAARLGGQVSFVSKVGKDIFGQQTIQHLVSEGIDISNVTVDPDNPSGVAQIIVDSHAENSIVVAPGANMTLSLSDIDSALKQPEDAGIVLMQLEIPLETVLYAARLAHEMGRKVILNPAPANTLPEELFRFLYLITPNESETEILTGIKVGDDPSAAAAAAVLHKKGVKVVIITLGANGAYISSGEIQQRIPAPSVQAIDTTAAGDTFNGALAVAISRGEGLSEAVLFANQAAALAVTRLGAQSSIPFLKEMKI